MSGARSMLVAMCRLALSFLRVVAARAYVADVPVFLGQASVKTTSDSNMGSRGERHGQIRPRRSIAA
jgi:hypothetical protein